MGRTSTVDALERRSAEKAATAGASAMRWLATVLRWLLGLYLVLVLWPRVPYERGPGYDRSFVLGLNAAHAQRVAFGPDLVYPYGPLGWVCHPLPIGGSVGLAYAAQIGVWAALVGGLVLLVRRVGGGWLGVWCLAVVGAAALIDPLAQWLVHLEVLVPVVGLLAYAAPPRRRLPALLALSALAAALFLVKLDAGVHAAALCAGLAIATGARCREEGDGGAFARRTIWAPPAAFLLVLAALYALESRRLDTLPGFLRLSVPVMLGYKEMSLEDEPGRLLLMLAALAIAFLALPAVARDRRRLTAALALVAVPAFLLWQRVSLRQDVGHQVSMLPRLAVLLLFPLVAAVQRRDRWLVAGLQAVVLVAGGVFVGQEFSDYQPLLAERMTGRHAAHAASVLADWDGWSASFEEESRALSSNLRLRGGAHAIVGRRTVDAVPWNLARVFAQGWSWRPRPALQDGNAYRPRLDRLDALHFAGPGAPDFVLAGVDAIDGRHVFLEAPLGWRALLDRYDLRLSFPQVLLLERRAAPRFAPVRRIAGVEATWDEELAVPESDELVLLSCEVRTGLAGRVAGILYHDAPVFLEARYLSGLERRWRTVRSNLTSGAIVSPLPASLAGLRAVFESGAVGKADRVAAVRLRTDEPWQYESELTVEWWELPLEAGQRPWRAALAPLEPRWETLGDCEAGGAVGRPWLAAGSKPRLGQPIEIVVEAAPRSRAMVLCGFGLIEETGPAGTLYLDPEHMLMVPIEIDGGGAARLKATIPRMPRLAGLELRVQVATEGPDGWRLGCALAVLIGR